MFHSYIQVTSLELLAFHNGLTGCFTRHSTNRVMTRSTASLVHLRLDYSTSHTAGLTNTQTRSDQNAAPSDNSTFHPDRSSTAQAKDKDVSILTC